MSVVQQKYNHFRPLTLDQVKVSGFLGHFIDKISHKTAQKLFDQCIKAGMRDQIDITKPHPGLKVSFQHDNTHVTPQMFWDSDWGKTIEVVAYALYHKPNPKLEKQADEIIDLYAKLQDENGYLNSWYQRMENDKRWSNLRDCHELYNAGHLMEGAIAYYYATGKRKFMDIMAKYANHIADIFGADEGQKKGYAGHPEIELALVKLARATNNPRYMDLAKFFIDTRGQQPHYYDIEAQKRGEDAKDYYFGDYKYAQAHKPVREQKEVVGHAVRAAYLYAAMADIAMEFDDKTLQEPLHHLWQHLTQKNLYITGGFGPSRYNEGLTFDYDLPNETAYAETCASVALVFWAYRMLGVELNRDYGDVMEQALYNGALAGLSLDATHFFYENPLESRGNHHRWQWHRCPCCPPNISRLITSIGTYIYGVSQNQLAVHLYGANEASFFMGDVPLKIKQTTNYPEDGKILIELEPSMDVEFSLSLRIPKWSKEFSFKVNGKPHEVKESENHNGYISITRIWKAGDTIELDLDMGVKRFYSHPKLLQNQGRMALMRGPLLYCIEEHDNGENLNSLMALSASPFDEKKLDDFENIIQLSFEGYREINGATTLYHQNKVPYEKTHIHAIPYYAWDNRSEGEMLVWVREFPHKE